MSQTREGKALPIWKQPVVHYAAGTIGLMALASGITVLAVQKMHDDRMNPHHLHPVHNSRGAGRMPTASHSSLENSETHADGSPQSLEDALHTLELDGLDELVGAAKKAKQRKTKAAKSKGNSKMQAILDRLEGGSSSEAEKRKAKKVLSELFNEEEEEEEEEDDEPESHLDQYIKKLEKKQKKSGKGAKVEEEEAAEEEDNNHIDFAKLLKEEKEREPEHTVAEVKEEFNKEYKDDAKPLMCSGCKLIAARFGHEVDDHDVHDQDAPHLMLTAKRKAINAACRSFRHLDVVSHESGPRFEAVEDAHSDAEERRRIGQRLCMAVLEDARFDMLMKMMHSKIPHMAHLGANHKTNWERFLCAEHSKLCKRREVKEDDEL